MDYRALSSFTAIERIYREVSQPAPSQPAPKVTVAPSIHLNRSDVDAFLTHKRDATIEELEYIVENAKEFQLTSGQRNQIGVMLTIMLASRSRSKPNASAEFLYSLCVVETPRGLLHDRAWVQQEMRDGAKAIATCKSHKPPRCHCWRDARERLWSIQDHYGGNSPEAWAAERLWTMFEELELASRPERTTGLGMVSQHIPQERNS
jgi:hypothetical protein